MEKWKVQLFTENKNTVNNKCNCVKCSISYHEAYIKGITNIDEIICIKCTLNIINCSCCLRKIMQFKSLQNIKDNDEIDEKLLNIKDEMTQLSESSLEVFQLLIKLHGIIESFKAPLEPKVSYRFSEIIMNECKKLNDLSKNNEEAFLSDYISKENTYQFTEKDENIIINKSKSIYCKNGEFYNQTGEDVLLRENHRLSLKSDMTECFSKYQDRNLQNNKSYKLSIKEKSRPDSVHLQNNMYHLKRNSTLSNTYRSPNFKFDGSMLSRVQNMSLNKTSISFMDRNEKKKTHKQLTSISATNLLENEISHPRQISLDSGIYTSAEI